MFLKYTYKLLGGMVLVPLERVNYVKVGADSIEIRSASDIRDSLPVDAATREDIFNQLRALTVKDWFVIRATDGATFVRRAVLDAVYLEPPDKVTIQTSNPEGHQDTFTLDLRYEPWLQYTANGSWDWNSIWDLEPTGL